MSPDAGAQTPAEPSRPRRRPRDIGTSVTRTTAPNAALRAVRAGMRMQRDDFAEMPDGHVVDDQRGGDGLAPPMSDLATPTPRPAAVHGSHEGVWLSRYQYHSSSRGDSFAGQHFVVVLQHGDRLTVRSLPGSAAASLSLDLTVEGAVVTGTWVGRPTPPATTGAPATTVRSQLLVEPTGRRMTGKWVGFGKDMDVNTGPWELTFQDASTSKATLDRYNTPPE